MINIISVWSSEGSFLNALPTATVILTTCSVALLTAAYFYYAHKYRYWKSKNVDGPTPIPLFGNSLATLWCNWHDEDMRRVAKYGRVFGVYAGTSPVLVISDPEILKDVLVRDFSAFSDHQNAYHKLQSQSLISSNGKRWKDMRSILSPTFTSGKMKAMHPLIKHCVSNLMKHIESQLNDSGCADFNNKGLFGDLTLDVIAKCAFAIDTNIHQTRGAKIFVKHVRRFFEFNRFKMLISAFLPEAVKKKIDLTNSPLDALDFLINSSRRMLDQRRELGGKAKIVDMLQLMIDAERTGEDGSIDKLTDDEIIANVILVLAAGYDTTGTLLTFATYLLALHPEVQSKLRSEIDEAVEADGGEIKYESVMNLKYLDAVVNETLRLYPPVIRFERKATMDYEFKSLGVKVRKGSNIYVPVFAIHHQEEFYPDADKFDPDRFMPENRDRLVPYTFLPFVVGPRNCIGARFALLEAKTALASILLKYDLTRSPNTADPLDFSESMILLHAKEVIVCYSERK